MLPQPCFFKYVRIWAAALLGLMLLQHPVPSYASEAWSLALERDGIRVWKSWKPGSDLMAFRAETTVTSSLSGLMALFYDLEAAPTWLDHTRRVVALARDDTSRKYTLLLETDLPWPLQDRDAVITGSWSQDPRSKAIMLRGNNAPAGFYPENNHFIRYRDLRSDWSFIPLKGGQVKVIMEGHGDPAGGLPAVAVNMLIQKSPFATLKNLRRVIVQDKYQKTHLPGIEE